MASPPRRGSNYFGGFPKIEAGQKKKEIKGRKRKQAKKKKPARGLIQVPLVDVALREEIKWRLAECRVENY